MYRICCVTFSVIKYNYVYYWFYRNNPLNIAAFENCKNLTELRLKSSEKGGMELKDVSALKSLTKMKHLVSFSNQLKFLLLSTACCNVSYPKDF